jgi:thiamine biosynthesis lipoprotein
MLLHTIVSKLCFSRQVTNTLHTHSAGYWFFLFLLLLSQLVACSEPPNVHPISAIGGQTMGTTYNISIVDNASDEHFSDAKLNAIKSTIDAKLVDINLLMSTYIADSEISRFNQIEHNQWFALSPETLSVIEYSLYLSELTNGKFDITVSPLVNLWGFGSEGETDFPSAEAIAKAKEKVGWKALIVDKKNLRIKKAKPLTIDLSAIAKGYGVDVIAQWLETQGIDSYLVEIGGEIRVKGRKPGGKRWRVGIETPSLFQQGARKVIELNDVAIATSGDYRNFFEKEGIRYSHTIDPVTGNPVIHNIASITVIVSSSLTDKTIDSDASDETRRKTYSAMKADGLATAFMTLGEEEAQALANQLGLPIYILRYDDEVFTESFSNGFVPYLSY